MSRRTLLPLLQALGLALALSACAGNSEPPRLLALPAAVPVSTPPAQASAQPAANPTAAESPVLVVRRLDLPEYLASRRVRYRADASTVDEWPHMFWAERFEVAMTREFVAALRQNLPGWTVCEGTCADRVPALNLHVEIVPLDYWRAQQRLLARARFALSAGSHTGAPPLKEAEQSFELPTTGDTAQAYAQALTELLRASARTVAPMIQEAPRR